MASIKAIEHRSVHQIQSGQVIIDLRSVVKELVENSLDAGAKSIEIRFKNHGLDAIEVVDNGKGIAPGDFASVALKHHTSKLATFDDLSSLDTFGFRGEALSSLCALSKLHVITARAEDGAVGKRLDFELSGKLAKTSVVAAQQGTTVCVEELFYNLPVRRKELEKTIKREYGKVVDLLHAYACISIGVRISASNQIPKGKKVVAFSTKGNPSTRENIINVYGAKTMAALVKLDLSLAMEPSSGPTTQGARNWATQRGDHAMEVQIEGYISRPVFGEGRQTPDRQMLFVNSRPCALPQVAKAMNEVYKSYNVSQSAFIFANLLMDTNAYDVNVSPDKRTILLHDQPALLDGLKTALTELFDKTDHTVPQSTLPNQKLPAFKPLSLVRQPSARSASAGETSKAATPNDASESEDEEDGTTSRARRESSDAAQPNLIQGWVGRDTETRKSIPPKRTTSKETTTMAEPARITTARHVMDISNSPASPEHVLEDDHPTNSTEQSKELTPDNVDAEPRAEEMSHSNEADAEDMQIDLDAKATSPGSANEPVQHGSMTLSVTATPNISQRQASQPKITSFTPSSQKSVAGVVQNAFDRMRPKRTPLQTAQITVGDTTTTTVIGSGPMYKKRRIHNPQDSQAIANFCASPLIARGLRSFAAPGTQMEVDGAENDSQEPTVGQESDDDIDDDLLASDSGEPDENGESPSEGGIDSATRQTPIDTPTVPSQADDESDEEYMDEDERKISETKKVEELIKEAEEAAARPTKENIQRASQVLSKSINRKDATVRLMCKVHTSTDRIRRQAVKIHIEQQQSANACRADSSEAVVKAEIDDSQAEQRLSLTVTKSDFARMKVLGQFNLGFILAMRPAASEKDEDELFIIDQHAADEKYNYERLQKTVTLESQRLVRSINLDLTAVEEETILNHTEALVANGFQIEVTEPDEDDADGRRQFHLVTLPIAGEKTFDQGDLEELLHLLVEIPSGSKEIPRPRKVQRMLAMRACRSSIMVGKTLTHKQMEKVVMHMGEMEKPWNCPHGRPTMRHLAGLGAWEGWTEGTPMDPEGQSEANAKPDYKAWLQSMDDDD